MSNRQPRILIVDDDVGHRQSLRLILEEEGFNCGEAENGKMAQSLLEVQSTDLVLTDLDMPVMNGLQLVEWMYQGVKNFQIPIIVVTGNLHKEPKSRVLEAGAARIFTKPYKFEHLLLAIRSYLPTKSPRNASCNS